MAGGNSGEADSVKIKTSPPPARSVLNGVRNEHSFRFVPGKSTMSSESGNRDIVRHGNPMPGKLFQEIHRGIIVAADPDINQSFLRQFNRLCKLRLFIGKIPVQQMKCGIVLKSPPSIPRGSRDNHALRADDIRRENPDSRSGYVPIFPDAGSER